MRILYVPKGPLLIGVIFNLHRQVLGDSSGKSQKTRGDFYQHRSGPVIGDGIPNTPGQPKIKLGTM